MKKNDKINPNKEVISEAVPYLVIILVVIIIRTFIATPIKVNGPSMETTLYDGNLMILNKKDTIEFLHSRSLRPNKGSMNTIAKMIEVGKQVGY